MTVQKPRIVVIGAGILGSAITYNLAFRGANVLLLDQGLRPATGVTGRAFGWINVVNGEPGHTSYSGEDVELIKGNILSEWEPRLRRVPEYGVFSRNDIALDPVQLAETFVATALAAGASVKFGEKISAIETTNGQVTGIRLSHGTLKADFVVVAAGGGIEGLLEDLGIDIGMKTSPALLLRYACSAPVINHILRGPRLEIRQASNNTLFVAKSYVEGDPENGPQIIGERTLAVMRDDDLPDDVILTDAAVGNRPIFIDGMPRLGVLPQVENLYVAVGHPGVLAPLIGRLAAEEILDGQV